MVRMGCGRFHLPWRSFSEGGGQRETRNHSNQHIQNEYRPDRLDGFYHLLAGRKASSKGGAIYRPFGAVCLETEGRQTMPDRPVAPENVLSWNEQSYRYTQYRFIYEED